MSSLDALSNADRRRAVRRRLLVGVVVLGGIAVALVLRCDLAERRRDDGVTRGVAALVQALDGEPTAFERAERALAEAATLTDPYPLFALEVARRLRERRWTDAEPGVQRVLEHLVATRYEDAVAAAAALEPDHAGREELVRLVEALREAHLARPAATEP